MTEEQKRLMNLVDTHPSKYPYVYELLKTIPKTKIKCVSSSHEDLINNLNNKNNSVWNNVTKFLQYTYSWLEINSFLRKERKKEFIENKNFDKIDAFLLDILKLFFLFDGPTREKVEEKRLIVMGNNINNLTYESMTWLYDGWHNAYLISKNYDKEALAEKSLALLNTKPPKEFADKRKLMLAYRLFEAGDIDNSIKEMRKLKFLKIKAMISRYKEADGETIPFLPKIINAIFGSQASFQRISVNKNIFLYRATKKKKFLKKLVKDMSEYKEKRTQQISNALLFSTTRMARRPQHALKAIEVEMEKENPDEDLLKIKFLKVIETMNYYYYTIDKEAINFFIIFELFFVIFLYFKDIKKIDIMKELEEN